MKKVTIILFFIVFGYLKTFGQNVSINSLVVNNISVNSTDAINIYSSVSSTISFNTLISFPSYQDDLGSINIYYQKNKNSYPVIAVGGYGGNLLFNGGSSTTRSFLITLNPGEFDAIGGYIYCEYKTSSGITYKSSNIPIVKIIITPGPLPDPNPNYASQAVPYEGIPLLPNFVNYNNISSQDWVNSADLSKVVLSSSRSGWKMYQSVSIRQRTIFKDGRVQYEPQVMNISVSQFFPNLSRIYVDNKIISHNQYIPVGETPQTIIGNQASESHSDGGGRLGRTVTNFLNNYQWQRRIIYPFWWGNFSSGLALYGWQDIPGATQANYTPPYESRGMEYRRLVLENLADTSIYRKCQTSNIVRVYPIDNTDIGNTICCDQIINFYSNSNVNPINGPLLSGSTVYKWQGSLNGIDWDDCSSEKDYTPPSSSGGGRGSFFIGTLYIKRLALDYSTNLYYPSNIVTVKYTNQVGKINNGKSIKTEVVDNIDNNSPLKIYPNPSSSIIVIEGIDNISSYQIKVIDFKGEAIILKDINKSDDKSLKLDISMLSNGIYVLELENEFTKFTKKIIKN